MMDKPATLPFTATYAWWFIPVMYIFLAFCILLDVCPDNRLSDWLIKRGTRPEARQVEMVLPRAQAEVIRRHTSKTDDAALGS